MELAIVILGVKLINGLPGEQMKRRVSTAVSMLEHTNVSCLVVTGCAAKDGQESEAEVMRKLLVTAGVDPAKVVLEPRACNTYQNIKYTIELLNDIFKPLSYELIICTEKYHAFRANMIAQRLGVKTVYRPLPGMLESYSFQKKARLLLYEVAAVIKDYARCSFAR